MKIAIMQPYFMPYIGYFQLISAVDKFIIYDDVNYIKQGWINRNRILFNGNPHYITIPLKEASSFKQINTIEIKLNPSFLSKTISQAYLKSTYYKEIIGLINCILNFDNLNLAKFIENSIRLVSDHLNIDTEIILSSDIRKPNYLKGEDKVIFLCKYFNADSYVNAIGGQKLYSKETFKNANLNLKFLSTNYSEYKQFGNLFIKGLSIIDVLMFNSISEINSMLDEYEFI